MDLLDQDMIETLEQLMDLPEEEEAAAERQRHGPSRAYYRDRRAMARTPADVSESPGRLVFVVDLPGVRAEDIRVSVEDDGLLCVRAKRRREEEEGEEVKYLRMERRMGKFMRKFPLPADADKEKIDAVYERGVLTVTVERLPPPEPKRARTIEVKVAGN